MTTNDRWTMTGRVLRVLLRMPERLLDRVIGAPPVVVDGRVLDRRAQAVLRLRRSDPAAELAEVDRSRAAHVRSARMAMPKREGIHVVDRVADIAGVPIAVRVYRRFGITEERPGLVYFHGGGWWKGDLESSDGACRILADVTGCVVVSVHYRRPPEHVFPAAVDDSIGAYGWVHAHADELGIDAERVGVMGESAGANLAAVVAQQARHRGLPDPVAQILSCPALDLRMVLPSIETFAEGFGLELSAMELYRETYIPDPALWTSPLASPLLADDLAGLAPALIVTAGFDPLRDDGEAYTERLEAAGVEVQYRCYDSQVHAFSHVGLGPDGIAPAEEIAAGVRRLLRG